MSDLEFNELKNIVECILFVTDKPVGVDDMAGFFKVSKSYMYEVIKKLAVEYQDRGIELREIAGGLQFFTRSKYASYLEDYFAIVKKAKLSLAALETLAIIAYKQPITRMEIEDIRGVHVDGVINNLLEKRMIKIVGRSESVGKPYLFGTSQEFLQYFGLKDIQEIPDLESDDMAQMQRELQRMEEEMEHRGDSEEISDAAADSGDELSSSTTVIEETE